MINTHMVMMDMLRTAAVLKYRLASVLEAMGMAVIVATTGMSDTHAGTAGITVITATIVMSVIAIAGHPGEIGINKMDE